MKPGTALFRHFLLIIIISFHFHAQSQLNNGGFHAGFGVDADTKADYNKYGAPIGSMVNEDWFSLSGGSKGVIDTGNLSYFQALLSAGNNISFVKRMSQPLYYKSGNAMWIDAVYSRDYVKFDSANIDTTGYTAACKNAQDPALWVGGPAGISNKNDLVDVFTHMRRNGPTVRDSLWLFTAASMVGTTGSKYFDVELFKNNVGYSSSTGLFTTAGPDEGHSQWKFDASGNVIESGDMIMAITYNPGAAPIIEVRIWVSRVTFTSVVPSLFNFNGLFDANSNGSKFGYASIVSKNGTTAFGSGIGNYSATTTDSTYSCPWGTGKPWNQNYEALQLVEIGINLTRIGIDPMLYEALGTGSACQSFFKSILFKSRSSASFASALNDFVGPMDFMRIPVMDYSLTGDTLSCREPSGTLRITNNTTAGLYTWKAINGGNITSSNPDSSFLSVNQPGIYVLQASLAGGCPVTRTDTLRVATDTLKPVATAYAGINALAQPVLFGGDPVASDYPTPFGRSRGLLFSWTGPSGFQSNVQNPPINTWGVYDLTVTEIRNGCTSTATVVADFTYLTYEKITLTGKLQNNQVLLQWENIPSMDVEWYEVERSSSANNYVRIGTITPGNNSNQSLTFTDAQPQQNNSYRVKAKLADGSFMYSNHISIGDLSAATGIRLIQDRSGGKYYIMMHSGENKQGTVLRYNAAGQLLGRNQISITKGYNRIEIPVSGNSAENYQILTIYFPDEKPVNFKMIW